MAAQTQKGSVVWEGPPGAGSRGKFDPGVVLGELKTRPGEWGVVVSDISDSYAHNSTLVQTLRKEGVEIRTAKVNGTRKLYARYPVKKTTRR